MSDNASVLFTAATFTRDTAFLATSTEILICDLPAFTIRRIISQPYFNDLHHVALSPEGTLYVAVTGLDAVAELTIDGETIRLMSVCDADVWERFSPDVDYRRIASTKPHRAHPNYVFFVDGKPWVTRFEQRDFVPLGVTATKGPRHAAGLHDGHTRGDSVFFTAVDGQVLRLCLRTGRVAAVDLVPVSPLPDIPLGWCRGLLPLDDESAWVGFTRLRYTKLRRNLSWVRHRFQPSEHARERESRIARYSLREPALLEQVGVEEAGINAVFSIHEAHTAW
jgi:hypothetical protein